MKIHTLIARDIPDLWFQAINDIIDTGKRHIIDKGSYEGQTRLEYDYFIGHIQYPNTIPLLPDINPSFCIPNPVDYDYIFGGKLYDRSYIEYLMTATKQPGESYTYGERLVKVPINKFKLKENKNIIDYRSIDGKIIYQEEGQTYINQIEWIIDIYKKFGQRNNQMILQVAKPSDLMLLDPPCLRHIDTRIKDGKLNFFVYFRSWDLWSGLPANLAAIQTLKEYMATEIGVKDGSMLVESKGLHLYGYAETLARLRCLKNITVV